jgi:hypothetical protein
MKMTATTIVMSTMVSDSACRPTSNGEIADHGSYRHQSANLGRDADDWRRGGRRQN